MSPPGHITAAVLTDAFSRMKLRVLDLQLDIYNLTSKLKQYRDMLDLLKNAAVGIQVIKKELLFKLMEAEIAAETFHTECCYLNADAYSRLINHANDRYTACLELIPQFVESIEKMKLASVNKKIKLMNMQKFTEMDIPKNVIMKTYQTWTEYDKMRFWELLE